LTGARNQKEGEKQFSSSHAHSEKGAVSCSIPRQKKYLTFLSVENQEAEEREKPADLRKILRGRVSSDPMKNFEKTTYNLNHP